MANRSYLYVQKEEGGTNFKDFSEWKTEVPLSHLLLVGVDTKQVNTTIWNVDEKIALSGDADAGRKLLIAFLNWLSPKLQNERFDQEMKEAVDMLEAADYKGERYHLELGEILELGGYSLEEMESETAYYLDRARRAVELVQNLIQDPDADFDSVQDYDVRRAIEDWERNLGLYFTHVTYFSLG